MNKETLETIAGVLDARGLPHRLRGCEWSSHAGSEIGDVKVGRLSFELAGKGVESACLFACQGAEAGGGRIVAHLHGTGCSIFVECTASTRAPVIHLHVYTEDALIYLNLDDLEPIQGRPLHLQATFYNGKNQMLYWGEGASSVETRCIVDGDGRFIAVGRDAMLSNGVYLRTHDGHALVDLEKRNVLNAGGDIHIGPHVWVAQDVLVLGAADVGAGSVLGAKSMVKGSVPPKCVAAGVPAKVLRENVSWSRVPNSLEYLDHEINAI